MAQCYLVIIDSGKNVLVAFKKVIGKRFKGNKTAPTVLNYAGQLVLPGGGLGPQEKPETGALREFVEETGVNPNKYGVILDTKKFKGKNCEYSATYLQVLDDFKQALLNDANANITMGKTVDDELHQVGFLSYDKAAELLPVWDDKLTPDGAVEVLKKRGKNGGYDPFDKSWFKTILEHCPSPSKPN